MAPVVQKIAPGGYTPSGGSIDWDALKAAFTISMAIFLMIAVTFAVYNALLPREQGVHLPRQSEEPEGVLVEKQTDVIRA